MLTLAVTTRCNLRCRHCWVDAGLPAAARDAPAGAVRRVVDEFAALGGETVWITGGEPLMHPEWPSLLAHCCSHPWLRAVGVQTNGALLDEGIVERLQGLPAKLCIQVSLDGSSPRTHDAVRGDGTFQRAMAGVRHLVAAGLGPRTTVAFTEMLHNMADIPDLLQLADELDLACVVGGTLIKDGRAATTGVEPPGPEAYRTLLSRYQGDPAFRALYDRRGRFSAVEWWKGRGGVRGEPCRFVEHPYVTAEGTLYPCKLLHSDAHAVSRVFERAFAAVLVEGLPRWRELVECSRARSEGLPACEACAARSPCAGGCMGRAHAASGSLAAVEDRCELRRAVHLQDSPFR